MNEEEIIVIEDETEEEIVVMNEDVTIDPTIPDYVRNLTKEDIDKLSVIDNTGNGDEYLSNDGTYKKMIDIGGTSDYTELKNKPRINDVELNGNKTLEELGIPLKISKLENDSDFITNEVADLMNYYYKNYIDNMPKTERFIGTDESPINLNELNNGIYYLEGKVRYSKDFTKTYQLNQGGFYIVSKITMYDTISLILFHNFNGSTSANVYMIVNNIDKYNNYNGMTYDFSNFMRTTGSYTIGGTFTFSTLPKTYTNLMPTLDTQLTNKQYVDTAISNAITTSITSALESDY